MLSRVGSFPGWTLGPVAVVILLVSASCGGPGIGSGSDGNSANDAYTGGESSTASGGFAGEGSDSPGTNTGGSGSGGRATGGSHTGGTSTGGSHTGGSETGGSGSGGGAPCDDGTFDHDGNAATACQPWSDCPQGSSVAETGTGTSDRECRYCAQEHFSSESNSENCTAWEDCEPGQMVMVAGSYTSDRVCQSCPDGTFSTLPNSTCEGWTTCSEGTYVGTVGDADSDRSCSPCTSGYTALPNQESCSPWADCGHPWLLGASGTPTSDTVCTNGVKQWSHSSYDTVWALAVDHGGEVLVGGHLSGSPFLTRFNSQGTPNLDLDYPSGGDWGSAVYDIETAENGSFIVCESLGPVELRKYDAAGNVLWIKPTGCQSLALDSTGNIYHFTPNLNSGMDVVRRDANGDNPRSTTLAAGAYWDQGSLAVSASGSIAVNAYTDANIEGTNAGGLDAFVSRIDAEGALLWQRQFGTLGDDTATGVAVDADENVFICGGTQGDLAETLSGRSDAFLRKYDATGSVVWTRQFGTVEYDYAADCALDADGNILVAGGTTGELAASNAGYYDAFVRKYDGQGNVIYTRQLGANDSDYPNRVVADPHSNGAFIAGRTLSNWATGVGGPYDAFLAYVDAP